MILAFISSLESQQNAQAFSLLKLILKQMEFVPADPNSTKMPPFWITYNHQNTTNKLEY